MELIDVITSKENLNKAYKKVLENKGAGGIDGMKVEELGEYIKDNKDEIVQAYIVLIYFSLSKDYLKNLYRRSLAKYGAKNAAMKLYQTMPIELVIYGCFANILMM